MDTKIIVKMESLKELTRQYPEASQSARVSRLTEALLLLERAVKLKTPVGAGPIHLRDTIFQKVTTGGLAVSGNGIVSFAEFLLGGGHGGAGYSAPRDAREPARTTFRRR